MNRYKGRRAKGQVFENLRENKFEELYGVIVWFPEPRTSRAGKSGALTSVYFVWQLAIVSATQRHDVDPQVPFHLCLQHSANPLTVCHALSVSDTHHCWQDRV